MRVAVITPVAGRHRHLRLQRRGLRRAPTLPVVRAVIQEILTAHFLITTPGYIERMLKLREIQLRI